jgi:pimeloyl-ACP methyl ester carboxylesterase
MTAEPKSKRVMANGISIHYWDWESDGPTIVMLHNSTGFGRIFDFVIRELHPQYHVIAPDQRGHGDSDKPATGYSGEDYTDDFNAFLDALGIERCVVAGNSLGVRVGIIQAARRPETVSHLILIGGPHYAFLFPGEDAEWWRNQSQRIRTGVRRFPSAEEAAKAFQAARPSVSPEMVEHVIRYNTNRHPDGSVEWKYDSARVADGLEHAGDNLVPYITQIRCPVLGLRAERSWELTPERMEKVMPLFPTATWVTIKDATYYLQLEQPKATAEAIQAFLTEHSVLQAGRATDAHR